MIQIQPRKAGGKRMPLARAAWLCAAALPALLALSPVSAKTLVYCSEGSPENFYPGVNTTGTSFDANEPIYNGLVGFERGGTKVVPLWPRSGTSLPTARNTPSTCARA